MGALTMTKQFCVSALAYEHPDAEPTLHTRYANSIEAAQTEVKNWQTSPPAEWVLFEIWEAEYNHGYPVEAIELCNELHMVQTADFVPYANF